MASRYISDESTSVSFRIRCFYNRIEDATLCGVAYTMYGNLYGNYLRPVIKLKSDVQFSGSGTETDPFTIAE